MIPPLLLDVQSSHKVIFLDNLSKKKKKKERMNFEMKLFL